MASMRRKNGRPLKLTPDVAKRICDIIREGNYRQEAARCAGVSSRTLKRWLQKGKRAKSGQFREFCEAVLEAEADAENNCVKLVLKAAKKDARHAEWWLERKFPERWGTQTWQVRQLAKEVAKLTKQFEDQDGSKPGNVLA